MKILKILKILKKISTKSYVKKYKSDIHSLQGFWYAMDNIKDYDVLNKKNINNKIFNKIYKLHKKLK